MNDAGIIEQLKRIADALEGLLESTNPINPLTSPLPEEEGAVRAFYTDENEEIIRQVLARSGKEYKPRTLKK